MKVTNSIIGFLVLIVASALAQETNEIDYITTDIPVYLKAGVTDRVTLPKFTCILPSTDFANSDKHLFDVITATDSHLSELANKTEIITAELNQYNRMTAVFFSYLAVLGSTVMCTDEGIPTILGNTSTISSTPPIKYQIAAALSTTSSMLPIKYQIAAALSTTSDTTYKFMYQDLDILVPTAEEDSYFGVKGREIFYCMQTRDYAQAQRLIDEYQAIWIAVHAVTNSIKRPAIK